MDPITVAVGYQRRVLDWPAGTRFYIPNLRRYFIVEDTCASCHKDVPRGASTHLDVWVGGKGVTARKADACMNAITDNHIVVKDPPGSFPVVAGPIVSKTGCARQFGDSLP